MEQLRHVSRRPQAGGPTGVADIPFGNFLRFSPFSCHLSVGTRLESGQARETGVRCSDP